MATTALGKEALPMPPGFESYSDAVGEGGTAYDWSTWKAQVEADAGAVANGYATGGEVAEQKQDYWDAGVSWKEHTDSTQEGSAWQGEEGTQDASWSSSWQERPESRGKSSGLTGEADAIVQFVQDNWEAPETMVLSQTSSFEDFGFSPALLDGIYAAGFVSPSKIQAAALPSIAAKGPGEPGQSLMAQAQNGSGKTAAFVLAVLSVLQVQEEWPQAVVISPTRELSKQNMAVINRLGDKLPVKTQLVCPGNAEDRCPKNPKAHVLVGTPGKLSDLCKKHIINCWGVKTLVLDEADVMLGEENQMGPQIHIIKQHLPDELQVLFFSATFPDDVRKFGAGLIPSSQGIKVTKKNLTVATIMQVYMNCADEEDKFSQLCNLYGCLNVSQSIVFVNQRKKAFELAQKVKEQGHSVSLICGTQQANGEERMDPAMRDQVMSEFRNGVTRVLIATDVLSRGIDVPQVTLVVNYELPMQWQSLNMETYLHRVGRTGRFGLKGIAVNLVTPAERPRIDEICEHYSCKITEFNSSFDDLEESLRKLR